MTEKQSPYSAQSSPGTSQPSHPIIDAELHLPRSEQMPHESTVESEGLSHPHHEKFRMDYALRVHSYICDFIKLADQKAGFIFALSSALITVLYHNGCYMLILHDPRKWQLKAVLCFLALIGLVVAAALSFFVVKPRLRPRKMGGLIFWGSIAEFDSADQYIRKVMNLGPEAIVEEIFDHCYRISSVCRKKYFFLDWAICATALGSFFTFFVIILS